jgi:hypothetical protein
MVFHVVVTKEMSSFDFPGESACIHTLPKAACSILSVKSTFYYRMTNPILLSSLKRLLLEPKRADGTEKDSAWSRGAGVRAALAEGACVRCALRLVGASRASFYEMPYNVLANAVLAILNGANDGANVVQPTTAPVAATDCPGVCVACAGLLQERVTFRGVVMGGGDATLTAAQAAALRAGDNVDTSCGSDWVGALVRGVAGSGFDLRDGMCPHKLWYVCNAGPRLAGIGLILMMNEIPGNDSGQQPSRRKRRRYEPGHRAGAGAANDSAEAGGKPYDPQAAWAALRTRVAAALGLGFASALPWRQWELKDSLRVRMHEWMALYTR